LEYGRRPLIQNFTPISCARHWNMGDVLDFNTLREFRAQ
jgi:hypothetical protein